MNTSHVLQYAVTLTEAYMEPSKFKQLFVSAPLKSRVAVHLNVSTPFTRSDVFTMSREKEVSMKPVATCCPTTGCLFMVHSSRGMGCATTEQLRVMVGGVSGSSRPRVICEVGGSIAMSRRAAGGGNKGVRQKVDYTQQQHSSYSEGGEGVRSPHLITVAHTMLQ